MRKSVIQAAILLSAALASAAAHGDEPSFNAQEVERILSHSPLPDPPRDPTNRMADDPATARLGQRLFFDKRLSSDGARSCASCHDPARGFTDGRAVAEGLGPGTRNTLSLYNAAYNRWYFWDGRADTLWSQALQPIERMLEMGGSRLRAAQLVSGDPALRAAYEQLFGAAPEVAGPPRDACPVPQDPGDPRNAAWQAIPEAERAAIDALFVNAGKAIAAYERQLVSRRSAFDIFAEGLREGDAAKQRALSPEARRGLAIFIGRGGCRQCHVGPTFSDGEFHDVGVPPRGGGLPRDPGRYQGAALLRASSFNAGGPFSDDPGGEAARRLRRLANGPDNWGRFRTPTLRNVELTAPYMHEGQYESLEAVLEHYSTLADAVQLDHHQEQVLQPLHLSPREIADLAAFLRSLTDNSLDPALLAPPPS